MVQPNHSPVTFAKDTDVSLSSLRPSDSNPSLRVVSNRPPSFRSTGSKTVYRHALLKVGNIQGESSEKDLPVPPVLTPTDPVTMMLHASPEELGGHGQHNHGGHHGVSKVRPALEGEMKTATDSDDNFPFAVGDSQAQNHHHDGHHGQSRGFLPGFGDKSQDLPASFEEHVESGIMIREKSKLVAQSGDAHLETGMPGTQASDRRASDGTTFEGKRMISPGDFTSSMEQKNLAEDTSVGTDVLPRSLTVDMLRDRLDEWKRTRNGEQRRLSEDELLSAETADQLKQRFFPEGLDRKRAVQWIRDLLKPRKPYTPKFTQLPGKQHPRHEAHEDFPDHARSALTTRVTTFSDQNETDSGSMNEAMRNLEQLLSEALHIANEVAGQDRGHVDDDHLHLCPMESSHHGSHPPSIHESLEEDMSTEDEDKADLAMRRPIVFVGANEGFIHGCDAISFRALKRHGLVMPDNCDGKVRGPAPPDRRSSLRRQPKYYRRADRSRRSPVLPMPPPDKQLKRQRSYDTNLAYEEDNEGRITQPHTKAVPNSREVREYIRVFHAPPITARESSRNLRKLSNNHMAYAIIQDKNVSMLRRAPTDICSLDGSASDDVIEFTTPSQSEPRSRTVSKLKSPQDHAYTAPLVGNMGNIHQRTPSKRGRDLRIVSLRGRSHVSIKDAKFSLTKSYRRQPIARDWSVARKRFVAIVVCLGTGLIGILTGIYAGVVPAVQYYIADTNHIAILGNVAMYLGMALPTFFCWPLPLLHGRRPYILSGLALAMPLIFPQAITVSAHRSARTNAWKWALLLPRGFMGVSLGFANMNFHSTLTDLFGASLMSSNPHQEVVDEHDVRRHGGGLGVWLGVWTWCFIGSLSIGFMMGALIIDNLAPAWGFYISIILIAIVLMLNVMTPEVRRSAWRRSVAESRTGDRVSRRVARGEIMMHRVQDGPKWWGQEVWHGAALSLEMLRQPGFTIMAVYLAWIYAQVVLVIILLGSLTSRYYRLRATYVGAAVSSVAIGAMAAVPFQKANLFSRARHHPSLSNQLTIDKKLTWTSHLVRRAIFTIILPIAGVMYAVVSFGPPVHLLFPCLFAAIVGFSSCLAIAECNGFLMETWDCSDLQPGMTGRSKSIKSLKKTNYSSFPRVQAGYAVIHSLGFIFAAGATGIGGIAQRSLGQRAATAVVASILLLLTLLLFAVLARFRQVQIIPRSRTMEMDKWTEERRSTLRRRKSADRKDRNDVPEEKIDWRPLIIGNPLEKNRRVNILELGALTRWTEIRKRNLLIDQSAHLNRQALDLARRELGQRGQDMLEDLHRGGAMVTDLVRKVSKRSVRSKNSNGSSTDDEDSRLPREGIGHTHASNTPPPFVERDCFIGQSVPEEVDDDSSVIEVGNIEDDYNLRHHSRDHASHAQSKVRPYEEFEMQNLRGTEPRSTPAKKESPDLPSTTRTVSGITREHHSHTGPKVQPADPKKAELEEAHGSHMQSKVKSSAGSQTKP
ncbi:hypothetical protein JX265_002872 [Neoarthrinium moseri]|uniref:Polyamine transport protein n=1 Tax=Neoarthrinium moseri TaxID=1658444 RepID=A0A9Q0AU01_9PEZI|nr:hypothetical protein JX265_002872 [Neoarthrinium moseri]